MRISLLPLASIPRLFQIPLLLAAFGCGDGGGGPPDVELTSSSDGNDETASPGMTGTAGSAADETSNATLDMGDTGNPGDEGEPVLLYEGLASAAVVPDWDPDDPRPLLVYRYFDGAISDAWMAMAMPVRTDGSLVYDSDDLVRVWGWNQPPPLLYDGSPIEGTIPDWSFDSPTPFVAMMQVEADASWRSPMFSVDMTGSLWSFEPAPRLLIWGWPRGAVGAPTERYEGGQIPEWDPESPRPLVVLRSLSTQSSWSTLLPTIEESGAIVSTGSSDSVSWGW